MGEVSDIDLAAHQLVLDTVGDRTRIPYDSLIVAAGASQSYFGHDEFATSAPSLKTAAGLLRPRGDCVTGTTRL
jgi:NADH:ubiquinone reductase (H+-translocating)